jgi:hypothetical protein
VSTSSGVKRTVNDGANAGSSLEGSVGTWGREDRGKGRIPGLQTPVVHKVCVLSSPGRPLPGPPPGKIQCHLVHVLHAVWCAILFRSIAWKTNEIVSWQIPSKDEDFEMAKCPQFVPPLPVGED